MSFTKIDARGCICPQPVIKVKKALAEHAEKLEVLVDNQMAVQNIKRFAASKNCNFSVEASHGDFKIILTREHGDL